MSQQTKTRTKSRRLRWIFCSLGALLVLSGCATASTDADGPTPLGATDGVQITQLMPGVRSLETFEQVFTLDFPSGWRRIIVSDNFLAVAPQEEFDLVILQPAELSNPTELSFADSPEDNWNVDDFDGWLAAVPQQLIDVGPSPGQVGALTSTRVEIAVTDSNVCEANPENGESCIRFARVAESGLGRPMNLDERYVIDWISLGEGELPLVVVGTLPVEETNDGLRTRYDLLLETLTLVPANS